MTTQPITINGSEHPDAFAAMQHASASGRGETITLAGRYFVVEQAEADRIAALGVSFAYITDHHGQVMTVPVN